VTVPPLSEALLECDPWPPLVDGPGVPAEDPSSDELLLFLFWLMAAVLAAATFSIRFNAIFE
jgi:hypothetical protein